MNTYGKHLWSYLHHVSLNYDINEKDKMIQLLKNLDKIIMCTNCANHYKENVKNLNLNEIVKSPDECITFFYLLHIHKFRH